MEAKRFGAVLLEMKTSSLSYNFILLPSDLLQVIVVDLETKQTFPTPSMPSKNWTPSPNLNSKTASNSSKQSKPPQPEIQSWTKKTRKPSLSSSRPTAGSTPQISYSRTAGLASKTKNSPKKKTSGEGWNKSVPRTSGSSSKIINSKPKLQSCRLSQDSPSITCKTRKSNQRGWRTRSKSGSSTRGKRTRT